MLELIAAAALGTSSKMDFLPLGAVRTDPLLNPTCLSDHVHTFYGAAASLRPETTYDDMRAATLSSGNVEENKSLYWHPSVYIFEAGAYTLAPIWFASAYYVWETGKATAFPNAFNMIARANDARARSMAVCEAPQPCERADCSVPAAQNNWTPLQEECTGECARTNVFPAHACAVLEISFIFPTCWDGVSLESETMMEHVHYGTTAEEARFDGDCPASHPVKLPEIQLYFRVKPYLGGQYVFADGTRVPHADYFSGWNATELQHVLDSCENESDAASPDAFCSGEAKQKDSVAYLTYADAPKRQKEDDNIASTLAQHVHTLPAGTLQATVSAEAVSGVSTLPRGACSGEIIAAPGAEASPPPPPPRPGLPAEWARETSPVPSPPAAAGASPSPSPSPLAEDEVQDEGISTGVIVLLVLLGVGLIGILVVVYIFAVRPSMTKAKAVEGPNV